MKYSTFLYLHTIFKSSLTQTYAYVSLLTQTFPHAREKTDGKDR